MFRRGSLYVSEHNTLQLENFMQKNIITAIKIASIVSVVAAGGCCKEFPY